MPTRSTTITGGGSTCSSWDRRTGRGSFRCRARSAISAKWSGVGSCGARMRRAAGTWASRSTNAGSTTASAAGQVEPATSGTVRGGRAPSRGSEPLGGRGKQRIGELPLRPLGAERLQHRFRLQAFAYRGGVHPDEGPFGVALRPPPRRQPLEHAAARVHTAGDLLVEAGGERQGPLGQPHAQPVYEGRAVRHHRARSVVLLR